LLIKLLSPGWEQDDNFSHALGCDLQKTVLRPLIVSLGRSVHATFHGDLAGPRALRNVLRTALCLNWCAILSPGTCRKPSGCRTYRKCELEK
jgi:hypothetical protein